MINNNFFEERSFDEDLNETRHRVNRRKAFQVVETASAKALRLVLARFSVLAVTRIE